LKIVSENTRDILAFLTNERNDSRKEYNIVEEQESTIIIIGTHRRRLITNRVLYSNEAVNRIVIYGRKEEKTWPRANRKDEYFR